MKRNKVLYFLGFILLVLNIYVLIEQKKPGCADAQTCIPFPAIGGAGLVVGGGMLYVIPHSSPVCTHWGQAQCGNLTTGIVCPNGTQKRMTGATSATFNEPVEGFFICVAD